MKTDPSNIIFLIPARAGSKGIPGKNIRSFCGKPLLEWTIEGALKSKYFSSNIFLSTDSKEIQQMAIKAGAKVPFLRPEEFATDQSPSIDYIIHALDFLKVESSSEKILVLLEPTSPLRDAEDIDRSIDFLIKNKDHVESVVGVTEVTSQRPEFQFFLNSNDMLNPYLGEVGNKKGLRRQDLDETLVFLNGYLYISTIAAIYEKRGFYHEKTMGLKIPKYKSLELDDEEDFLIAEAIMKSKIHGAFNSFEKSYRENS